MNAAPYLTAAAITRHRRTITTMRRARAHHHAAPRIAKSVTWRAATALERLQDDLKGDTMPPTKPVTVLHRCRECRELWNGYRAAWRVDDHRDLCNDCCAQLEADDDLFERYLNGELDQEDDDDQ